MKNKLNLLKWRKDSYPKQNLEPNPNEIARKLFDADWYEKTYMDSVAGTEDSWAHFLEFGLERGYDPNYMFDTDWYLDQYPEIAESNENPLLHYVRLGAQEGRNPSPFFNSTFYLNENPDIKSLGVNPLLHFLEFGCEEGRSPYRNSWPVDITTWNKASDIKKPGASGESRMRIAILIPVYNKWFATERCIRAIQSTSDIHLVDIVVVNDGSTDDTLLQLERFPTIRVINTSENIGFAKACNFAFNHLPDYEFIYLLNNDTEVICGFISNSLALMKSHPRAALVGSTLLSPDGSLQECGAIVWRDGTVHNFGRNKDLGNLEFRFSRKVDYCSGAGLLIRNELLNQVGLFDERFAPAYYEDTDLSFKLREIGFEVWVCFSSLVIHYEGLSRGVNTDVLVNTNRDKFLEKWETVLSDHPTHSDDPDLLQKAAMRHTKYADIEIMTQLTNHLWRSDTP